MNWRRIIGAIVVIAILGAVGAVVYQNITESEAAEALAADQAAAAETADPPEDFVFAEGVVAPLRDANLSLQGGGRIAEILVNEGDAVQVGQPLLRLEATNLEIARDQAAAEVALAEAALVAAQMQVAAAEAGVDTAVTGISEAEAQLALLLAGPRPEEIAAAEFDILATESNVGQAAANQNAALTIRDSQILAAEANAAAKFTVLEAVRDAYDDILNDCSEVTNPDGSTTTVCWQYGPTEEAARTQLEQAQLEYEAAQAALNSLRTGPTTGQRLASAGSVVMAQANQGLAEAQLALLLAGPLEAQVRQAEIGVELAATAVTQAATAVVQAEAGVRQAEAVMLQAEAGLASAELALVRMTLQAPFAGTIVALNVVEGELASPGVPVLTLADFSQWRVETTDLTELDVVAINPGDAVAIRIDAVPDKTIQGTIIAIDSVATLSRGDVTYAVTIELADVSELPLRWGMTVFVDVDMDS